MFVKLLEESSEIRKEWMKEYRKFVTIENDEEISGVFEHKERGRINFRK